MRHKVAIDAVVEVSPRDSEHLYTGVVVHDRDDAEPRYLVIETDALGRHPHGRPIWRDADDLTPLGRKSRKPGRIYRRIQRDLGEPEQRPCLCACCSHVPGFDDGED